MTEIDPQYILDRQSRTDAEVSAHTARLNTINGSIGRTADALEKLRGDTFGAIDKLRGDTSGAITALRAEMVERDEAQTERLSATRETLIRTTTMVGIGASVASVLTTALIGWMVVHHLGQPAPSQTPRRAQTSYASPSSSHTASAALSRP